MRGLVSDLLQRETGCEVFELARPDVPDSARTTMCTFVLVVDAADFPACCHGSLAGLSRDRFVVVGQEPDAASRDLVASQGAGAWIPRERLGDDLVPAVLRIVGDPAGIGPQHESPMEPRRS